MMVFLDTHIVLWLYFNLVKKLSKRSIELIETTDLVISPMVCLELEYLYEKKKLKTKQHKIISELNKQVGLKVVDIPYRDLMDEVISVKWTRDAFDRMIVGHAQYFNSPLITKDRKIQKNYPKAVW